MCATFKLSVKDSAEIEKIIKEISDNYEQLSFDSDYFPKQLVPVAKLKNNTLSYELMKWGFPKLDSKEVIFNARSETALEKRLFCDSLLKRRCLIPSTGFYEWSRGSSKQKYIFTLPDSDFFYLGGFYNVFDRKECCTILTSEANESMKDIHSRMPVILYPDNATAWLNDSKFAINYINYPLPELIRKIAI